jgi:hypothetical protein
MPISVEREHIVRIEHTRETFVKRERKQAIDKQEEKKEKRKQENPRK